MRTPLDHPNTFINFRFSPTQAPFKKLSEPATALSKMKRAYYIYRHHYEGERMEFHRFDSVPAPENGEKYRDLYQTAPHNEGLRKKKDDFPHLLFQICPLKFSIFLE